MKQDLTEITSVRLSKEDKDYCEQHGLSLSFLLRQAIQAEKLKESILKQFKVE